MEFKIDNISPLEYFGRHKDLEKDPDTGLSSRLIAIGYSGESEVFVTQFEMLSLFDSCIPLKIQGINVEKGRNIKEYSGYQIDRLRNDINEKATQWASVSLKIIKQAEIFQSQIENNTESRFTFNKPARELESLIEHYFYKLISILDLYASLSQVFNRKSPPKFGQQIAKTRKGFIWDQEYQNKLIGFNALSALRDYRNIFGHEASIKIRPVGIKGRWVAVIVANHTDTNGLYLVTFLHQSRDEFLSYSRFFEGHYAKKSQYLSVFSTDNQL